MIRHATKHDAPVIFELMLTIWSDMQFPLLTLIDFNAFKTVMITNIQQENSKFSYRNAYVYTQNDTVIAVLYHYDGEKELAFNYQFVQFISAQLPHINGADLASARETADDEWYIDSLVVHPKYRGQFVGTTVLKSFLQNTFTKPITLNCDVTNQKALTLYQQLGFTITKTYHFLGHDYYHMVYQSNNGQH